MSTNGAKKIPPHALAMLQAAQLKIQLAQEQFNHLCTRIEAAFGVRLKDAQIQDDGTVIEAQPPEAPGA